MANYGYIRVSTRKQTTENQRFVINNYCAEIGIEIDAWINETISGKVQIENRKLGELSKAVKTGDTIICSELSRISREMFSMLSFLGKCKKYGIEVISVKERFALIKDSNSKYFAPIVAVTGEMERDLIAKRTTDAIARLIEAGFKPGRPIGSKSKVRKLTGKENIIIQMRKEKMTLDKMSKKLKVSRRILCYFIKENNFFLNK